MSKRSQGVVAAGHPETGRAAAAVLGEGGNAVDAALAGMCAAMVVEPVLASLGGGGFLVARPADGRGAGRTVVYDFFCQTPRRRRPAGERDLRCVAADFGPARQDFHVGLGTAATPGVVGGLFEAHRELGSTPIRRIVEPAIALARNGVALNAVQADILRIARAIVESSAAVRALFESRERPGELIGQGEIHRLPELADALEILAIEGPDLFYRGEMGHRLAADCTSAGGLLSMDDLAAYTVERRRPLDLDVFGACVQLNPPPALGGILVGLGLLLWSALGLDGPFGSPAHLARLARVMTATAEARPEIAVGIRAGKDASDLLDPTAISRMAAAAAGPRAPRGTTQISVIDAAGGAASLSISNGEGCGYVLPGTGIILNNMLGEQDRVSGDADGVWPTDTRMASMMTPALVLEADGGVVALGSGGSNRIRSAMLQALLNLLYFRMPLAEAVAAPRLHVENAKGSVEPGFEEGALTALAAEVDELERWPSQSMFFGGVHAARGGPAGCEGAGDERRGGAALSA